MDWVLTRETVIVLAVLGAIASVAASILQLSGRMDSGRAKQLNTAGYGFMAASMLLYVVVGFRA